MIATVSCNPALDLVVYADTITPGEVNRAGSEALYCGGKGINVSCVLREWGIPSIAFGFVAGFTGETIENLLRAQGVQTDFVHLHEGFTRINVKLKERGGKETEINGQGEKIPESAMSVLYQKLDSLGEGDFLVLAGSVPAAMPENTYEKIIAKLQNRGIRFVVDATGGLLARVLPYHPFLVKPNQAELCEILGGEWRGEREWEKAAAELQRRGAKNVLLSLAGDGALLLDEQGVLHRKRAPRGEVVNSVGAGDAMIAGFLAGYLQTGDYDQALKYGIATGSATAFSSGLAKREDSERLLQTL